MGIQRKKPQSKGKEESSVKETNEMEASEQSDIQVKRMVTRMSKELSDNYKELNGNYNMKRQ